MSRTGGGKEVLSIAAVGVGMAALGLGALAAAPWMAVSDFFYAAHQRPCLLPVLLLVLLLLPVLQASAGVAPWPATLPERVTLSLPPALRNSPSAPPPQAPPWATLLRGAPNRQHGPLMCAETPRAAWRTGRSCCERCSTG